MTFLSTACAAVHYGVDVAAVASFLPLPVEIATSVEGEGALAAEAALGFAIYKAAAPVRWPQTGAITALIGKSTGI